ncbi:hypothetical protein ABW20_dc0101324 [Dactylellina cionopaga]|nr:hypothetical protein ABW20_dc0101324 [Dactylellina cionopaga]
MSTPQPIPPRLTPSVLAAAQRASPSLPSGSPRPPTSGSADPPTPRPSQLPFPGASSIDQTPSTTSATTTTATATTEDGNITTQQQQQPSQLPPAPFIPFFTLIQDATTSSHFHPTVRYVFSDDEFDPLAILPSPPNVPSNNTTAPNSLSNSAAGATANNAHPNSNPHSGSGSQADVDSNGSGQFGRRDGAGRNNERVILVDVSADGQGILSAHSLSAEWQVSGVSVTKAPTWMSDDKELVGFYQERLEKLQGVVDWAEGRKGVEGDAAGTVAAVEGMGS